MPQSVDNPARVRSMKRKNWFGVRPLWVIIFFLSFFLCVFAYFIDASNLTIVFPHTHDWDLHLSWSQAVRTSILQYHQLPLWNPYRCGGAPLLGEAESDVVSLYAPFLLMFGPALGYIVVSIIYFCIGLYGFYKLARYHDISKVGSVLVGIGYIFSGLIILPVVSGMTNFLSVVYLPFVVLHTEQYFQTKRIKHAIWAAACMAFMFLSGFHYPPILILYVLVYGLLLCIKTRQFKSMVYAVCITLLFVGFSAVKLLPTVESFNHRTFDNGIFKYSGYSVKSFLYSLISREQRSDSLLTLGDDIQGFLHGVTYRMDENGMYVGVVFLGFAVLGLVARRRKLGVEWGIFILFLLLAFGENITPSLYKFVQVLPFFSLMRVAQRYRYIFMVPFVLYAGIGFDVFFAWIRRNIHGKSRFIYSISVACVVLLSVDMLWVNTRILYDGFHLQPVPLHESASFTQVCQKNITTWEGYEFPIVLTGLGVRDCTENVLITKYAACIDDPKYKGEVYVLGTDGVIDAYTFTPNKLTLEVTALGRGVVVINQNFDSGWVVVANGKVSTGISTDNLLSTPIESGVTHIAFYYIPWSFILGCIITIGTIIASVAYIRRQDKK